MDKSNRLYSEIQNLLHRRSAIDIVEPAAARVQEHVTRHPVAFRLAQLQTYIHAQLVVLPRVVKVALALLPKVEKGVDPRQNPTDKHQTSNNVHCYPHLSQRSGDEGQDGGWYAAESVPKLLPLTRFGVVCSCVFALVLYVQQQSFLTAFPKQLLSVLVIQAAIRTAAVIISH
jgi:hypothetical protein